MKKLFTLSFLLLVGLIVYSQSDLIVEPDTTICEGQSVTLHYTGGDITTCLDVTDDMLVVPDEYTTIQDAIDAAVTEDTIVVLPGTYSGVGNRDLTIDGKDLTIIGSCGPNVTIIDCGNSTRALTVDNSVTIFQGFTIMNGFENATTDWSFGFIFDFEANSGGSKLIDLVIKDNQISSGYITTRGVLIYGTNITIENCLIYNNNLNGGSGTSGGSSWSSAGYSCILKTNESTISNCVFYNNNVNGYHKTLFTTDFSSIATFENSIVWGNNIDINYNNSSSSFLYNITYSDIEGGFTGTGNIDSDPLFTDPTNGDFTLQPSSPCIGTSSTSGNMGCQFIPTLEWSTGETTSSIVVTPTETTTYSLTETMGSNSESEDIEITVIELPDVSFTLDEFISYDSDPITLSGTPTGGEWTGNGVDVDVFDPETAGLGTTYISYSFSDVNECSNEIIESTIVYDTLGVVCVEYISVTDTLFIDVVLSGVPEPDNTNMVKVYPNPTSDFVIINTGNYESMDGYQIKIYNTLSQLVWETFIEQEEYQIDVNTFGEYGTYFIQIYDDSETLLDVRKLILQ